MPVKQTEQTLLEIDVGEESDFLHTVLEQIDKAKEAAPKGAVLMVKLNTHSYADETYSRLVIYYLRDKTEEEMAFDKRMQDRRDAVDRKLYLSLKAKFEPEGV